MARMLFDTSAMLRRGQMYVGAFLKRPEQSSSEASSSGLPLANVDSFDPSMPNESAQPPTEGAQQSPASSGASEQLSTSSAEVDGAADLHEVGTFAQVHTMAPAHGDGAGMQLLLFGHRRLKRIRTVRSRSSCACLQLLQLSAQVCWIRVCVLPLGLLQMDGMMQAHS